MCYWTLCDLTAKMKAEWQSVGRAWFGMEIRHFFVQDDILHVLHHHGTPGIPNTRWYPSHQASLFRAALRGKDSDEHFEETEGIFRFVRLTPYSGRWARTCIQTQKHL